MGYTKGRKENVASVYWRAANEGWITPHTVNGIPYTEHWKRRHYGIPSTRYHRQSRRFLLLFLFCSLPFKEEQERGKKYDWNRGKRYGPKNHEAVCGVYRIRIECCELLSKLNGMSENWRCGVCVFGWKMGRFQVERVIRCDIERVNNKPSIVY